MQKHFGYTRWKYESTSWHNVGSGSEGRLWWVCAFMQASLSPLHSAMHTRILCLPISWRNQCLKKTFYKLMHASNCIVTINFGLTLYSIIAPFDAFEISCIWKYNGKWSICSLRANAPFPIIFSKVFKTLIFLDFFHCYLKIKNDVINCGVQGKVIVYIKGELVRIFKLWRISVPEDCFILE